MNLSISLGRETKALCGRKITAISIILQPYVVIRYAAAFCYQKLIEFVANNTISLE